VFFLTSYKCRDLNIGLQDLPPHACWWGQVSRHALGEWIRDPFPKEPLESPSDIRSVAVLIIQLNGNDVIDVWDDGSVRVYPFARIRGAFAGQRPPLVYQQVDIDVRIRPCHAEDA